MFDNILVIISFSGQKISKAGKSILQGLLKNQQFERSDFINLGYGLLCGKLVQLPLSAAKPKFIEVLLIISRVFCFKKFKKGIYFNFTEFLFIYLGTCFCIITCSC